METLLYPLAFQYGKAVYAATITGSYTVSDSIDPNLMTPAFLDLLPSGAQRDVEFPQPSSGLEGRIQVVRNNAAAGGYTLRIRSGTSASATLGTIATLQPTETCICVYRQDPADSVWKLYTLSLGYVATSLGALTLSDVLTLVASISGSTAAASITANVTGASASPDGLVVAVTQTTNNRSGGTATGVDITVTGRAGDAGGTYEAIRGTSNKNGGSSTTVFAKIVAGFTRLLDLSETATGEGNVMLADNLADAFSIRQASTYLMKVVTTTGAKIVQFAQGIGADTISEVTSAAGVTVDGCLIKDGRAAALATAAMFTSTEQTGTGSSQNVAHGFGAAPSMWWAVPTDTTAGWVVSAGSSDATNVAITVTSGAKFRVYAIK